MIKLQKQQIIKKMSENLALVQPILKQLQIKYKPEDKEDLRELKNILTNHLSYPSTNLAILHAEANKLGMFDLRKNKSHLSNASAASQGDGQGGESEQNVQSTRQKIYCQCCGLPRQLENLNLCTRLSNVRSVGIATRFVFLTYEHLMILMVIMFFTYSLYAIISNVKSCNYDENNLQPPFQTSQYKGIMSSWVFQVSLQANLVCSTDTKVYEIQCWLGVAFIILTAFVLILLKYRKFRACLILQKTNKSVQNLSILIQNMPVIITRTELQRQLRQYRKKHQNEEMPQSLRQITVVKVNRAAPFYLSSTVFKDKLITEADEKYEMVKKKLINLILERRQKEQFSLSLGQRKAIYRQFEQVKSQRIKTYQKVVLDYALRQKQKNPNKLIKAPTFVTFQSSFNRQFLLKMHSGPMSMIKSEDCFYFQIPSSDKKVKASISEAPKPQQVLWTNLGQDDWNLIKKKIIFTVITLLFLAGTCAAYYYMQLWNFDFSRSHNDPAETITVSYVIEFVGLVVSYIISDVILYFTRRERNITYMHEQRSLNNKATIASLSNWMLVPFIFNMFFLSQFVSITSLSQTVYTMSLFCAYYFVVLKAVDPLYYWFLWKQKRAKIPKNKLGLSQRKLNRKLEGLQFMPGFQCSFAIRAALFTCFFSPLQPIVIIFTLSGLFFMNLENKYYLIYRSTRPVPGNRLVNISINKYLVFGPILFGLGCLIWPYYINKQVIAIAPSVVSISLGILLSLIPWEKIIDRYLEKAKLQKIVQEIQLPHDKKIEKPFITSEIAKKQKLYSKYKNKFDYEYDRLNYLTAKQSIQKYLKQEGLNVKKGKKLKFRNNLNIINNLGTIVKSASRSRGMFSFVDTTIQMNKYKDNHLQPIDIQSSTVDSSNPHNPIATKVEVTTDKGSLNKQVQCDYEIQRQVYSHVYDIDDHEELMQAILDHIKNNMFTISESKNMTFWKNKQQNECNPSQVSEIIDRGNINDSSQQKIVDYRPLDSSKPISSQEQLNQGAESAQSCNCDITQSKCQLI